MDEKTRKLKQIRDEIWELKKSPLYRYRKKNNYYPVIGEGSHEAKIMFVGEAPGKNEAETGRPFCGASGRTLDKLLASADIKRQDVYITNVVKDRPPQNRDPNPEEINLYSPFLVRQINIIQPFIIASLGRFSMKFLMEYLRLGKETMSISKIHGKVFEIKTSYGKIKFLPLFHPAVSVYNPDKMPVLEKDFQILKNLL